jgi:hypothetical protein
MAELKTKKNEASVEEFLSNVKDEQRREDSLAVLKMMKKITKEKPKMWGPSIIGFGDRHYKYASGREGDWFIVGFSPRKQNLTLYLSGGLEQSQSLLKKLGKHTTGVGCLYINKLEEVDQKVLEELIANAVARCMGSAKTT